MAFTDAKKKLVWSSTTSKWAYSDGSTIATTLATAVSIAAASNIVIDGSKSTNTVFSLTAGTASSHNIQATLLGGAGNDTFTVNTTAGTNLAWINGGAGDDVITGGKGKDTFEFTGSFGTDTVNSVGLNNEQDTIKLGTSFSNLSFSNFSTATTLTVSASGLGDVLLKFNSGDVTKMETEAKFIATDKTFFVQAANSAATTFTATGASVEYIRQYGSGNSFFKNGGKYDTLIGGSGNDTFAYNKDIAVINGGSDGKDVVLLDTNLTTTQTIDLTSAQFTSIEVATVTSKAGTAGQVLRGLTTADTLNGGVGADSIWSRGGNDQLSGGAGVDTFWFAAGDGVDTITDITAGTKDVLKFVGVNQADLSYAFDTSASTSLIITYGTSGSDMVFVKKNNAGVAETVQTADKTFGLLAGYYDYSAANGTSTGTTGADYIRNFYSTEVTATAASVLTYDGKGGADTMIGGTGKDSFVYTANLAYVDGGAGKDTLSAAASVSAVTIDLYSNASKFVNLENVIGGQGNDVLRGYNGASETMDGGAGADALWSAGGDDSMFGGAGNDTYWFASGDGNDTLTATTEKDVYKFAGVNFANVTFAKDVDNANNLKVTYGSDTVTVVGYNAANMTGQSFQTADATFHLLTDQNGTGITGVAGADLVKVFNDAAATIDGKGGADSIYGGAGDDIITYYNDIALVDGGAGSNKLDAGTGSYSPVTIDLNSSKYTNIQQVVGGSGNDVVRGTAGAQTLSGDAGNDALWGAAGDDYLIGGDGVDTYWFTAGDGTDTIDAGTGSQNASDVVKFYSVASTANVTAVLDGSDLNLTLTDGSKLVLQSWSGTNKVNKFTFDSGTYKLSDDAVTWTKLS